MRHVLANRFCAIPGGVIGLVDPGRRDRAWRCSARCCSRPRPGAWCSGRSCRRSRWPNLPLGTDALGRDVVRGPRPRRARLAAGRRDLDAGRRCASACRSAPLAGYFGGRIDDALMRFTEFFQTIPSFALAIVLVAIFSRRSYRSSPPSRIVSWPPVARLVRGELLSLRTREFVQAAIVTGQSHTRGSSCARSCPTRCRRSSSWLADGRHRDPARIRAVLPRPGRPQPDVLGLHDRRRPHRAAPGLVDERVSRPRDPADGAGDQPGRRRPERRAQPAAAPRGDAEHADPSVDRGPDSSRCRRAATGPMRCEDVSLRPAAQARSCAWSANPAPASRCAPMRSWACCPDTVAPEAGGSCSRATTC